MSYVLIFCAVYHNKKSITIRYVPIFSRIKRQKQFVPPSIVTQREHHAVDILRIRIAKERLRILRIAKIAFEKVCGFQDKTPVNVSGIRRIHKSQITASTVVIEKPPLMRIIFHPNGGIDRDTLGSDSRIVSNKGFSPKTEKES